MGNFHITFDKAGWMFFTFFFIQTFMGRTLVTKAVAEWRVWPGVSQANLKSLYLSLKINIPVFGADSQLQPDGPTFLTAD